MYVSTSWFTNTWPEIKQIWLIFFQLKNLAGKGLKTVPLTVMLPFTKDALYIYNVLASTMRREISPSRTLSYTLHCSVWFCRFRQIFVREMQSASMGIQRDELISALVTTSRSRLKALACWGDLGWDEPISPFLRCCWLSLRDVWWDQPISHSLQNVPLLSLILPFETDICMRIYLSPYSMMQYSAYIQV